ncbi:MAG: protein kinase [Acidobacteria bacterium]|nr:protein kinase [Acidobacteriota bacterium]
MTWSCRVYDIGEVDGRHFLSMEYIDGEDLASLMKRIGHLSNEKALDIARQLVAGLSVAHERGVLHRDLKPANIMLDGHGRVRITDFGLAIAVGDESQAEEIAGTPAYMAPEQLAGKGATVRSDIYSLGLILYEIYTGKKAFTAKTLAELREQKETQTPRAPSELRDGIDPVVERVIQRCMEKDPNARPASVAQLAQALPGGDPLAAAIAAGETPSPEMVAASGSKEGLRPLVAWGLLIFIIIGLIASLAIRDRTALYRRMPFENPPEHLLKLAQQIIDKAGYSEEPVDSAYGFSVNDPLLKYIESSDKSLDRWKNLDANAILFWYRQSPRTIQVPIGNIGPDNPPLQYAGEALIELDTNGRMEKFRCLPPEVQAKTETEPLDWGSFLSKAGFDLSQWTETDPQSVPPSYADDRVSWLVALPNQPDAIVRIEASAFQGKPVSFERILPKIESAPSARMRDLAVLIGVYLLLGISLAGGIFFAQRNLRLGRGDRRNAKRLALFVLGLFLLSLVFRASHISFTDLLLTPYTAAFIWLLYMAIEPFVRRKWPHILVSWTRLLSGEWKDPLVARDALIGIAFGILVSCILGLSRYLIPSWLGYAELAPPWIQLPFLPSIMGVRFLISWLLGYIGGMAILIPLAVLCLLFIMRILLRNQKLAIVVCMLIYGLLNSPGDIRSLVIEVVLSSILFYVLTRFGLLATANHYFAIIVTNYLPVTLDASAWYSEYSYITLAIFAAIVLYAFHTSLGGRPMFGTPRLDE